MSDAQDAKPSRLEPPKVSRRSFLSLASLGSFLLATATAVAGMLRLPKPAVLPGPVRRFKIGNPEQFAVGSETHFEEENFFVFRDAQGVFAISATCTHLGCAVARSTRGFECPCHGSKFGATGAVEAGPAPRPLPWLEVGRAADGQLVVYADNEVPAGTRFRV
ncbi:MAG TPA: Rieske 2Fe-2S domain-containing protein [Candidatus Nitrosotenuis sp.]|nr:Rieske 2Fe-2S domain-containing protein [Candidatus Nitrosotenuis sp.]